MHANMVHVSHRRSTTWRACSATVMRGPCTNSSGMLCYGWGHKASQCSRSSAPPAGDAFGRVCSSNPPPLHKHKHTLSRLQVWCVLSWCLNPLPVVPPPQQNTYVCDLCMCTLSSRCATLPSTSPTLYPTQPPPSKAAVGVDSIAATLPCHAHTTRWNLATPSPALCICTRLPCA